MKGGSWGVIFVAMLSGISSAQTWPEYHLTNGNHSTSYGVKDYDFANPFKYLYVDSAATLYAGSTQLDDIHDSNQVFLNGGNLYASKIDADDFTWISGRVQLDGGTHTSLYGLDSGTGKSLYFENTSALSYDSLGALPTGNELNMFAVRLNVNNLDMSGGGYSFDLCDMTVKGELVTGSSYRGDANDLTLTGSNARWNNSGISIHYSFLESLSILDGAKVNSSGRSYIDKNTVLVSGEESEWISSGGITVGDVSTESDADLIISNGARVAVSRLLIGNFESNGNEVEVTGAGSELVTEELLVGDQSLRNRLHIKDGGTVTSTRGFISSSWENNAANVTGDGSLWRITDSLVISGAGQNDVIIASGGKVIVGSVTLNSIEAGYGYNSLRIRDGGQLVVGSDLDASSEGFSLSSGGKLTVDGQLSGLSLLETNSRLEAKSLLGQMLVHGTLAPGNSPADSVMDGALTIASDGMLEMELGGYEVGTEYDRFSVTGLSILDGTLDLVFLDSFSPTNGTSFDLFNWDGGVSGEFVSIQSPALTGGLYWDTSALYTSGQLSVIPEPGVLSLLIVFGGGFWVIRRYFPAT